jgi:four helix bundle protein
MSVGANYRAAFRARSDKEFISKLSIVLEESDESLYWLEIIQEMNWLPSESLSPLISEANELTAIFVSSLKTVKERLDETKN